MHKDHLKRHIIGMLQLSTFLNYFCFLGQFFFPTEHTLRVFPNLEFLNHFSVVRELGSSRSEQERTGSEFEEDLGEFFEFSQKHILRKKITNSFI